MMRATAAAMLLALAGLGGCGAAPTSTVTPAAAAFTMFYADAKVTGEISAPAVAPTGDEAAELPLRLRLRNRSDNALELSESTRCTVLRWSIVDAQGKTREAMPNRPCAQQLAAHKLPPAQTIQRAYEIQLTARYRRGRYTLRFRFWGYPGEHAFEVR